MLKQHKAASVGGAAGKQLPGMAGGGGRRRRRRRRRGAKGREAGAAERGRATRCGGYAGDGHTGIAEVKWGGVETQIAAGERLAKGLALRGKVRSSGRFGKHTPAAMYGHVHGPVQYAIPQQLFRGNYSCKLQEGVKYLVKWGNNQAKEKSEMPVVIGR